MFSQNSINIKTILATSQYNTQTSKRSAIQVEFVVVLFYCISLQQQRNAVPFNMKTKKGSKTNDWQLVLTLNIN